MKFLANTILMNGPTFLSTVINPSCFSWVDSRSSRLFIGASFSWESLKGSSFFNTAVAPNALLIEEITTTITCVKNSVGLITIPGRACQNRLNKSSTKTEIHRHFCCCLKADCILQRCRQHRRNRYRILEALMTYLYYTAFKFRSDRFSK